MDKKNHKLKLIFVARKFENMAGGLERISIDLMNKMTRNGHKVGLITWDKSSANPHYIIDNRVKWLKLNIGDPDMPSSIQVSIARLRKARIFIRKFNPDIILGFQSGASLFAIFATIGLFFKILAAERVSPDLWKHVGGSFKFKIINILNWFFASKITVQFPQYKSQYPYIFRHKITSIHNPVYPADLKKYDDTKVPEKIILCVARLCYQKNQDLLIDAFQRLSINTKDWKLVFVGDGEYYDRLNSKVKKLGLQHSTIFCGNIKNVSSWYQKADIFAFPSFFEGFPNALAEALSWGIPSIGLRNTLGVNSLIEHNVNGLLVDSSSEDFSGALNILVNNAKLRKKMSLEAKKISSKYSPENSYVLWESLFESMI
tara:strand:+ start:4343 stop:5461 length:1119 start_codon:yes stop_codon:yes gene_type:complete